MGRTGIGETPPPLTGVPLLVGLQPAAFSMTALSFPAESTDSIPSCKKPTTVPVTLQMPPGQRSSVAPPITSYTGTVTTESLRLILATFLRAELGLLSPPVIVTGAPGLKMSCPEPSPLV